MPLHGFVQMENAWYISYRYLGNQLLSYNMYGVKNIWLLLSYTKVNLNWFSNVTKGLPNPESRKLRNAISCFLLMHFFNLPHQAANFWGTDYCSFLTHPVPHPAPHPRASHMIATHFMLSNKTSTFTSMSFLVNWKNILKMTKPYFFIG